MYEYIYLPYKWYKFITVYNVYQILLPLFPTGDYYSSGMYWITQVTLWSYINLPVLVKFVLCQRNKVYFLHTLPCKPNLTLYFM